MASSLHCTYLLQFYISEVSAGCPPSQLFLFMASLLEKQGEAGVELEEVGKIWKPRRDLGGTLITKQVQCSECIRP